MKKNYRQRINYDEVYDLCCEALRNGPGIVKVVCPDDRDPASFRASFDRYLKHNGHDTVSISTWNGDLLIVSDNGIHIFDEDKAKTLQKMADECLEYAVENGACRISFHDRYASTFKTRSLEIKKGSIVLCKRGETVYVFDEKKIPTVEAVYVEKPDRYLPLKDIEFVKKETEPESFLGFPESQYKLLETNPVVVIQLETFDAEIAKRVVRTIPRKYWLHVIPNKKQLVLVNDTLFERVIINSYKEFVSALSAVEASKNPTVFNIGHMFADKKITALKRAYMTIDIFAKSGLEAISFGDLNLGAVNIETALTVHIANSAKEENK